MPQEFFVTYRIDKWFVDDGLDVYGPYLSQRDAVADAIDAAEQLARPKKKPIDVLLKIPGSNARLLWSSKKYFAGLRAERPPGPDQPGAQGEVENRP